MNCWSAQGLKRVGLRKILYTALTYMSRVVAEGRAVDPGHGVCLPGIRAQLYDSGQLPDASVYIIIYQRYYCTFSVYLGVYK